MVSVTFSRYPEIVKLPRNNTTSNDVINHLRSPFVRHGIPEKVISDHGPQFIAADFANIAEEGFTHVTTSLKYPQANGEVERAIQTTKGMLKKSKDPYLALMSYRSTPLECRLNPVELLMGRKIRTTVLMSSKMLVPQWPYLDQFLATDQHIKNCQRTNFNQHHCARALPPLSKGDQVWIPDHKAESTAVGDASSPRSYLIQTHSDDQECMQIKVHNYVL